MDFNIRRAKSDDLLVWPDGTMTLREEYCEADYSHMSDDFAVIPAGSAQYDELVKELA